MTHGSPLGDLTAETRRRRVEAEMGATEPTTSYFLLVHKLIRLSRTLQSRNCYGSVYNGLNVLCASGPPRLSCFRDLTPSGVVIFLLPAFTPSANSSNDYANLNNFGTACLTSAACNVLTAQFASSSFSIGWL